MYDARQRSKLFFRDEAALALPAFGPRIGKEQEDAAERSLGQPGEDICRVARVKPDICEALRLDRGERLGDAVDEWFAADKADIGPFGREPHQVFAAAEADLQPHL